MKLPPFAFSDAAPEAVVVLTPGAANTPDGDWPNRVFKQVHRLELHAYMAQQPSRRPASVAPAAPARARALVYAGGGYLQLVHDKEGVEVARWLNSLGIDAYVVVHRLPGQNHNHSADPGNKRGGNPGGKTDGDPDSDPDGNQAGVWPFDIALQDGLRCLQHLATLPPLPLFHVGLSSGGHLAGVVACQPHPQPGLRAAGALIAYAPLNANHRLYKAPAGKPDYPPPEKQAFYDAWPIGMAAQPHGLPPMPVFLAYALHDTVVPVDHALNFLKAMQTAGGDVEAHVFPQAAHGFALRDLAGPHGQWPALAARWFNERLVQQA